MCELPPGLPLRTESRLHTHDVDAMSIDNNHLLPSVSGYMYVFYVTYNYYNPFPYLKPLLILEALRLVLYCLEQRR